MSNGSFFNSKSKSQLSTDLNSEILTRGQEIFERMGNQKISIFNKDWWYGQVMEWSMKNEAFKTQMFRFVDVLPYLKSGSEVTRHLKEYFSEGGDELPSIFNFGVGIGAFAPGIMASAVRKNVTQMAKMFITGETPKDAFPVLKKQRQSGIGFTVDLLGEATLSEKEAEDYQRRYLDLISWLGEGNWEENQTLDSDNWGPLPAVNVSVKLTAIYSQIKVQAWESSKEKVKERLRPIFDLAMEKGAFINIDMESYDVKDLTLEVFEEIINEPSYRDYPHWGIVVQAYLRDSRADCEKLIRVAKKRKSPFTIRLVKGAYWDYEIIEAQQKNWPIPVYTNKKACDANYEDCTRLLIDNHRLLKLAIGSHNVRSIAHAMSYAKHIGLAPNAIEFQMLYGMADPIKASLVEMGYRIREYATVGELIPGMAYLVRRLLENTSNESFLRSKFVEEIDTELLLSDPGQQDESVDEDMSQEGAFFNEPLLDFAESEPRESVTKALRTVEKSFPVKVTPIVNGRAVKSRDIFERRSPNDSNMVVGQIQMADLDTAEEAVKAARQAFPSWSQTPATRRAELVDKLADLICRDRLQLMSVQIHEVGKPWAEADGDITEAIDFCRYYARDMRALNRPRRVGHAPGEITHYDFVSRGVAAVIAPWNFPLAILTGLASAAAVTGNTVIIKPAEQSSVMAFQLMRLIKEAGFPEGVFQFLPGYGEKVGKYLVDHKDIVTIGFTGSKDVGLQILQSAGRVVSGQSRVKKCIIEMGGKNAIIVDSDADLDEAVKGVVYSAFGFQGQKCSACSRVLVLEDVYDRFVERLVESTRSLAHGPVTDPKNIVGPVVDPEAQERIFSMIETGKNEGRLLYQMTPHSSDGYFVGPTIIEVSSAKDKIATEEIFGPVLAVLKVKSIDEALQVALDSEYALTGGLYSRSPANIEKVRETFLVGNLYINRGCTGAMVDRHPFGGFKMSGVGSKTGGPDYLRQFMDPRCVIENTMRRGFAPNETLDGSLDH